MYYRQGNISNTPPIPVSNPTDSIYEDHGWIPYIHDIPDFNPLIEEIVKSTVGIKNGKAVQKYTVEDLPQDEQDRNLEREAIRNEINTSVPPQSIVALSERVDKLERLLFKL